MTLPPATIEEGPGGIAWLHAWRDIVMGTVDTFPRYVLDRVSGLRDRPETEDNRAPATGRPGEVIYPSEVRGKNVVYEGRVQAADPASLEVARTAFLRATVDNAQDILGIAPQPARGGVQWYGVGRVISFTCPDEQTRDNNARPTPWQRDFVLTIRLHVPTFFVGPVDTPNTATDASSVTAHNAGDAPTYLNVTVTVPSGTPDITITNTTTGSLLKFLAVPAGTLVVNFLGRSAVVASTDAVQYLDDVNSNWWDEGAAGMVVGDNVITQTGGTDITVDWHDSSY